MKRTRFQFWAASLALFAAGWAWSGCLAVCAAGVMTPAAEAVQAQHACCAQEKGNVVEGDSAPRMPCRGMIACGMQPDTVALAAGQDVRGQEIKAVVLPMPWAPPLKQVFAFEHAGRTEPWHKRGGGEDVVWRSTLLCLGTMLTT